jgi:hypothetical protein
VPATDSFIVNAAGDLPGPGAVMLLGEVSVSPGGAFLDVEGAPLE